MNISELILSGNLLDAKRLISERLNELALDTLDDIKYGYAQALFSEDFDANKFKGKTEMDDVKDDKANGEDVGEDVPEPDDEDDEDEPDADDGDDESDDDDDKNKKSTSIKGKGGENITVNIKEGIIPTGSSTKGAYNQKGLVGKGAAETPSWKKFTKTLNGKVKAKAKVDSVVSEDTKDDAHGAKEMPAWKKFTKALNGKVKAKAKVDSVVAEKK